MYINKIILDETSVQQQPTPAVPTLNSCMPTQVAAATQTPSESVISNKRSATTTSTTTAMTTTTNKGKKARYQVRPQPPSSAPQSGLNNIPPTNSVAQSDVASSSKNNLNFVFVSFWGILMIKIFVSINS